MTGDAAFAQLLHDSYARLVGAPLVPAGVPDAAGWLYRAPFGLLAHDASADPVFTYANLTAQRLFGYSWDEFVGLPSRLSAAAGEDRDERRALLDAVAAQGYADDYRGLRVSATGRRFWIEDATVWNLLDGPLRVGQAALIRTWRDA